MNKKELNRKSYYILKVYHNKGRTTNRRVLKFRRLHLLKQSFKLLRPGPNVSAKKEISKPATAIKLSIPIKKLAPPSALDHYLLFEKGYEVEGRESIDTSTE